MNFIRNIKIGSAVIFVAILFNSCVLFLPKEIKLLEKTEIFYVSNDKKSIILDGVINSSALDKFKTITKEYPNIRLIKIKNCDGSINDDINLELAKYIHDNKFNICLMNNGIIASGGTDLFLAGIHRNKGYNTKIGVHSWAGRRLTAIDFPVGDVKHLPYINYYIYIGFTPKEAQDFYYFTINSAPADSIHWMTNEEISKYKLIVP